MIVSHIVLKNWRNFRDVNVQLGDRTFLVGPNASGKSNFLDVFRFLRDIAKQQGGGLQQAVQDRNGISKIRCLAARMPSDVEISVEISDYDSRKVLWKYEIGIKQETRGFRQPYLAYEKVWKGKRLILNRPDENDNSDSERRKQTHLEQINTNADFREVSRFFESTLYLHLVPQFFRNPEISSGKGYARDPFGRDFLEMVARTPSKVRNSRLRKIEEGLRIAVPQLKNLEYVTDLGVPHLQAIYEHWRPTGAKQREDQFSDGTLRLIGLLWSLLENDSLLLLEEPELSLNSGIVSQIARLIYRLQRPKKRQTLISTHSADLLSDVGIDPRDVLLLTPTENGTDVQTAASIKEVVSLLNSGMTLADVVLPRTKPTRVDQLSLALA